MSQGVAIGRVVKTKGLRGELKIITFSGKDTSLQAGKKVALQPESLEPRELTLLSVVPVKGGFRLQFQEINSREEAGALVGAKVYVEQESLPTLQEGEFYCFQLVGLEVYDPRGLYLGKVKGIMPAAGHDILIIADGEKEWLLPAVEEFVTQVELKAGKMVASPPEGLRDLQQ